MGVRGSWRGTGIVAAALLLAACSLVFGGTAAAADGPGATASIVNGREAGPGQFPSIAYVTARFGKFSEFSCTGSVVSPYVVITAGHCVESPETGLLTRPQAYTVITGRTDIADPHGGQELKVARAVVSPRYSPFGNYRGDLGLLVLKRPTSAPPIPIAHRGDDELVTAGTGASVAGWGLTEGFAEKAPTSLMWGKTEIRNRKYCRHNAPLPPKLYSTSIQLCTFDEKRDAAMPCNGDSGGPLLVQAADGSTVQVGITSLGPAGCFGGAANVFTRIDRFSAWIDAWILASEPGSTAPKPEIGTAQGPSLPTLYEPEATRLMGETLRLAYGQAWVARSESAHFCEREDESRFYCLVQWKRGRWTYFGTVQVYLVLKGQEVAAGSTYAIHRVASDCLGPQEQIESCPFTTRRG